MEKFAVGEEIEIRCTVDPGPFSKEKLITFKAIDGEVSGFVDADDIRRVGKGWAVRAIIKAVSLDTVDVLVKGHFFTTNGLAKIPRELASAA